MIVIYIYAFRTVLMLRLKWLSGTRIQKFFWAMVSSLDLIQTREILDLSLEFGSAGRIVWRILREFTGWNW
jgi:hypothetical protein